MFDLQSTAYGLASLGYDEAEILHALARSYPETDERARETALAFALDDVRDRDQEAREVAERDEQEAVKAEHDLTRSMHDKDKE